MPPMTDHLNAIEDSGWPAPPGYELVEVGPDFSEEPAILVMLDGTRLVGDFVRFNAEVGMIEFSPTRSKQILPIPLISLLEVRLTRPVLLRPRSLTFPELPRSFRIELSNGQSEEGDVVGVIDEPYGLFVHLQVFSGTTLRLFYPRHAIARLDLGPPGEAALSPEKGSASLFPEIKVDLDGEMSLAPPVENLQTSPNKENPPLPEGKPAVSDLEMLQTFLPDTQKKPDQVTPDKLLDPVFPAPSPALAPSVSEESSRTATTNASPSVCTNLTQLEAALARQRSMPVIRLGEALIQMGAITEEQIQQALVIQKTDRKKPLGEILISMGAISEALLKQALSQKLGIPTVSLKNFPIDPTLSKLVPEGLAREFRVVPLFREHSGLVVAVVNPLDFAPLDKVRFSSGMTAIPVMASAEDIIEAINQLFGKAKPVIGIEEIAFQLSSEEQPEVKETEKISDSDSALVRLVNKMIQDAYDDKVSDIHIESNPGKDKVLVRFRRDGVLQEYLQVPSSFRAPMISRIKIMASLDISERRHGQDGRINFHQYGGPKLELRVAVIPTSNGLEDVVMRLLAAGEPIPIDNLGLLPEALEQVKTLSHKSFGLLLVCGPTGSGKTTTLHSVLAHINTPDRKIWTAEDPIEITQKGLRQVQVNAKINWSFADAMRSFLRADPDVIMIGEMRDQETAHMAIEASLTGHLVFSTLHTNTAPESVVRLLQMGMDPYNFADSLAGILAQRLARKVCKQCTTYHPMPEDDLRALADEYCFDTPRHPDDVIARWRAKFPEGIMQAHNPGCPTCGNTGYKGRLGIHELLCNSPSIRELIQGRARASELRAVAVGEGMLTLKQDGIEKCLMGLTDLREVRSACS